MKTEIRRLALLCNLFFIFAFCQSAEKTQQYTPLPESFRRSGMISSSTYQVYLTVTASDPFEAKHQAQPRARKRAYELLVNEPFIPRYPTYAGKIKLESIIRKEGRIVQTNQIAADSFEVVFHIHKIGLREDFQKIW